MADSSFFNKDGIPPNDPNVILTNDHGSLGGLLDDDHPQYHNDTRGDARYYTKSQADTLLGDKAPSAHTHTIANVTDLQTSLDNKSNVGHTHDDRYYTETEVNSLLAGKSDTGHTHYISDVSGLQTTLDGKASSTHTHVINDVFGLQGALDNKAAATHTHVSSDITDFGESVDDRVSGLLQAGTNISLSYDDTANTLTISSIALGGGDVVGPASAVTNNFTSFNGTTGKLIKDSGYSASSFASSTHTHAFADLTSKPTTISGFGITDAYTKTEVDTALLGKSDTTHTHTFASLTSKPTTLSGYGITDAALSTHNHTVDSLSNVSITSKATNDLLRWNGTSWVNYADSNYATASHTHTFASLTSKPTTLSGYGITDAVSTSRLVSTGTGLSGGGDLSADRTISLANTTVTAGSYTNANITVDAQGRLTSASNGSSGLTIGSTATSGGAAGQIMFDTGSVLQESSNLVWDNTNKYVQLKSDTGAYQLGASSDVILTRKAAAGLQLGAADAAAPVAQSLSVQSVLAGTSNTAGANLTIKGSQGTGTGAGGSIIFQVAPAGTTGTAQNALATALTINADKSVSFSYYVKITGSTAQVWVGSEPTLGFIGTVSNHTFQIRANNVAQASALSSGFSIGDSNDVLLTRRGAANLRFGAADAAAPVAQTLSVQSVVAGTTNTAGANLTITGSQGTGTGAGGDILFNVAPAGTTGTAQNALSTALRIYSNKTVGIATFTVANLPTAGTSGRIAVVTDATSRSWDGTLTGGGTTVCLVYDNGSSWVSI